MQQQLQLFAKVCDNCRTHFDKGYCKNFCSRSCYNKNWYLNHIEERKKYNKLYSDNHLVEKKIRRTKGAKRAKEQKQTPENKKKSAEWLKKWRKNNKQKRKAEVFIQNNPKYRIHFCEIGPTCIWCKTSNVISNHHANYLEYYWSKVIGLCKGGHMNIHSLIKRGIIRKFIPGEDFEEYKQYVLQKLRQFQQQFQIRVNELASKDLNRPLSIIK